MPEQRERATAEGGTTSPRRLDLSVAQVAASALAAVVGAVLASELGVYGTIIGAAVVSIGATTGGAFFQHLFRRTGEQLREAADRGPGSRVNDLQQVPLTRTAPMPADRPPSGEWNDSPLLRARRRWTWRTYALMSVLVFALAMTPILVVELASGKNLHSLTTGQQGGGTSILPGGGRPDPAPPVRPTHGAGPQSGAGGGAPSPSAGTGGGAPRTPSSSATPSASPSGVPSTSPAPTPSATPSSTPSTAPAATGPAAAPGGSPSAVSPSP